MSKILIVDDDELLSLQIADALRKENYLADIALTNLDRKTYLGAAKYDLIILDWELPDATGPEILKQMRASDVGNIPILMLTARASIQDKKTGFDCGADDYLTKPFDIIELIARVKALLKRPPVLQTRQICMRNIVLDMDRHEVFLDGTTVDLYPKEYSLLEFLMKNPNQIFTADDLIRQVWSTDSESSLETVRVTIMRIRQKIKSDATNPLIVNMRKIGYRLEP